MLQTNRLRDPYPLTWEIPVGVTATTLLLAVLGVQVGRSIAHWTAGGGWVWPRGRALFTSLGAVLSGRATAGLDPAPVPSADAATVMGWIVAVEAVLATVAVTVALLLVRRWGPGRMRGMATPQQARSTLGPGRLRRVRTIVRPDLYPRSQNRRTP
jgi:hypothetical protein